MGTSDEREENVQRRNQDVQMRQLEHAFPDPASEGGHGGRAYANGGGLWTTDKLGMSGAYAMEVDPTHDGVEHMPMSPNSVANSSYGHQNEYNGHAAYAHQRPVGPVATPITRFLTKQTFGFIPKPSFSHSADSPVCSAPSLPLMASSTGPGGAGFRLPSLSLGSAPQSPTHSAMGSPQQSFSFSAAETLQRVFGGSSSLPGSPLPGTPTSLPPRNGSFSLPPLKRACLSPSTALPSLPSFSRMSLEDICQPFRYQRSLSCPSDAMVRGMPSEEVMNEPAVAPAFILSPADIPKNRLERSSSVDATSVLAMREAHARARGMESTHRPESIDLHRWLDHGADHHHSLDSLADSAYSLQAMESEHSSVESPRGLASPRGDFHESDHRTSFASNQGEQRREKKLCAFPECTSNAVTRGLCISHGGGRRCQRKGCTRGTQSKGLCVAHGGGRICRAKGCSNIQRSMGLCIRHGGGKRCSVPGCQKGVVRQDLCTAHGGKRKCKVDDCNKHVKKKGLCRSHANAVFGTSSPRSSSPEFMH